MEITCPKCTHEFDASSQFAANGGAASSQRKADAAKRNGKKGGRPKTKRPPGLTFENPNEAAKSVIDQVEEITRRSAPPAVGQAEQ